MSTINTILYVIFINLGYFILEKPLPASLLDSLPFSRYKFVRGFFP